MNKRLFNPVAEIMKSVDVQVVDRRTYRSPKDRACQSIRSLRCVDTEEAREIVTALQVRLGQQLQASPEQVREICGLLNDAAIALLDAGADKRSESEKLADAREADREMLDDDERVRG